MTFAYVIDIDQLAVAISENHPTGSDIRINPSPTSDYYFIKDARNGARAAERAAMFEDTDADLLAPWRKVVETAEKILTTQSKDLEVAGWYTEGLIRLHGFDGLRDGFALIDRLINEYWDELFPVPDEDGLETKVAPLIGLNGDGGEGTLMTPIRNAPITLKGDYSAYSFFQYQQARDASHIEDKDTRAAREAALGYSLGEFDECVNAASTEWAQNLVGTLESASAHYKSFNSTLRIHCGHDAPPSSNISALLDEVLRTTRFIYKVQLDALAAAAAADSNSEKESSGLSNVGEDEAVNREGIAYAGPVSTGPIASREEALKLLELAAQYFRRYEPHTPLASSLERLLGWGRMSVSELMMELLPDAQARAIYSQLTGVALDGSEGQSYVAPVSPAAAPVEQASQEAASADIGW
ncbi:MAG: type VI secretion system protein TssA [Gammaproteobacteria bacterium]|nr:type VI secretion system protein TssA [Gammaproteobacteria bacterium]